MLRSVLSLACVLSIGLPWLVGCGGGTTVAERDGNHKNDSAKPAVNEDDYRVVVEGSNDGNDSGSDQIKPEVAPPVGNTIIENGSGETDANNADANEQPERPDNLVPADVDATGKGEGYGGDPITAPVRALARTRERVKFLELEANLKIHRAINGDIKTLDELMIYVRDNNLRLPELPEGDEYYWDAESQELWVQQGK